MAGHFSRRVQISMQSTLSGGLNGGQCTSSCTYDGRQHHTNTPWGLWWQKVVFALHNVPIWLFTCGTQLTCEQSSGLQLKHEESHEQWTHDVIVFRQSNEFQWVSMRNHMSSEPTASHPLGASNWNIQCLHNLKSERRHYLHWHWHWLLFAPTSASNGPQ